MRRLFLSLLLPVATAAFVLGLILPLMELERLYVFTDRPSLLQLLQGLWSDGETWLAAVVALFSVIFPAAKIVALHVAVVSERSGFALTLLHALGKWSMMDVMLVALVIFAAKTSGFASAATLPGLWCYGAAVVASALSAALARR
ncbi:paraquat-inducible protein A [Stappia sp.]|uniref:paraquat-inducible protein A n=1 Tax=Stappia sp. TaxID=1870903 RepID=UPI003A9A0C48